MRTTNKDSSGQLPNHDTRTRTPIFQEKKAEASQLTQDQREAEMEKLQEANTAEARNIAKTLFRSYDKDGNKILEGKELALMLTDFDRVTLMSLMEQYEAMPEGPQKDFMKMMYVEPSKARHEGLMEGLMEDIMREHRKMTEDEFVRLCKNRAENLQH
jgi:hypothetical protein